MGRNSKTPTRPQADQGDDEPFDWSLVDNETFEFKIAYDPKPSKKRKRGADFTQPQYQNNPLDGCALPPVTYAISPTVWDSITRYRKFTIASETFEVHDCVLVKLDEDEELHHHRHPHAHKKARVSLPVDAIENRWIAHVLEVRAADEQHVFLRVNWLYRPEDLPEGRQPYHGAAELVPSNFMQVIDAMAVDGSVKVRRWHEENEDEEPIEDGLFFRQWYDNTKKKLSPVRQHCVCRQGANPDKLLIKCPNQECKTWLHAECIEREAVKTAYRDAGIPYPGDEDESTSAPSKGSQKGKSKSKAEKVLTNGHAEPDLVFTASLVKEDEGNEHKLRVLDKRGTGEPEEKVVQVSCLVCNQQSGF